MAQDIPDRIAWALELIDVQPSERVLEIGCGNGVAVGLICERLTTGKLTAIDRSETMIKAAVKRNQAHIEAGKAEFVCTSIEEADIGNQVFDTVFAINVNEFWTQSSATFAGAFGVITSALKSGGRLLLIVQPPKGRELDPVSVPMFENVRDAFGGFARLELKTASLASGDAVCVSVVMA